MIAFLLILGVVFYAVATSLINLVSDYLFQTKISAESATVEELSVRFAPYLERGDAEALHEDMLSAGRELEGRLLVIDSDGKVQADTFSELNGLRMGQPEVVSVLRGGTSDYGFHLLSGQTPSQTRAMFDFLRNTHTGKTWVGYFTAALVGEEGRLGVLLYSIGVQDMVDNLRVIQDKMLLFFAAAAAAMLVMRLTFSRVITKPIERLTAGIQRMGRGDLSTRVEVTGHDEMTRLAETFNQMSEKLEHQDALRNEFVSNASHELKTPMATIKILLESMLYEDNMDPALRREFMTDIDKELDRMSKIVTDLLTLVRADSKDFKLNRQAIMLRELTEDTLRRLKPLAETKNQRIRFAAEDDCPVFADATRLQQAIYNIVDNAIKYSPDNETIRVSLEQRGKTAVLEIADHGPGIPAKDQPHIFDRFYRVDKARARATGGNGLGLSIAHQAVMLHGGALTVRSEEGKGTTFRMEIPISTQSGEER